MRDLCRTAYRTVPSLPDDCIRTFEIAMSGIQLLGQPVANRPPLAGGELNSKGAEERSSPRRRPPLAPGAHVNVSSPGSFKIQSNMSAKLQAEESTEDDLEDFNALVAAAELGDEVRVRKMLSEGSDVNWPDAEGERGSPAVPASVFSSSLHFALSLLRMCDTLRRSGWTPLVAAAEEGHANVLRVLLEQKGVLVNLTNRQDESALMRAVLGGHAEAADVLLATPGIDVNAKTATGKTALSERACCLNVHRVCPCASARSQSSLTHKI